MKQFDWKHAVTCNSPAKLQWIFENHKKKVAEQEYIEGVQALRQYRIGDTKHYTPSFLKRSYRDLVKKFGFFI